MPTVIELRKLARLKKIKGRSKMNKVELMKALNIKPSKNFFLIKM